MHRPALPAFFSALSFAAALSSTEGLEESLKIHRVYIAAQFKPASPRFSNRELRRYYDLAKQQQQQQQQDGVYSCGVQQTNAIKLAPAPARKSRSQP